MFQRHRISFGHAIDGIKWALASQPNYRIHLFLSFLAVFGGIVLNISYAEWMVIITLICIGLAIETINSAIEKVCDAVSLTYNEHIKLAKDAAAGGMLFFALGAFGIAMMIFLPKFIAAVNF